MNCFSNLLRVAVLGASISTILSLTGCADNQAIYGGACVTCFDNPVTGEPLNYDSSKYSNKVANSAPTDTSGLSNDGLPSASTPKTLQRKDFEATYNADVDTTAMRLKEAFGYETREEAESRGPGGKMMFSSGDYAYQATPGAFYMMKKKAYGGELTTRVSKAGSKSRVVFSYSQKKSGVDASSVMAQIKAKATAALY